LLSKTCLFRIGDPQLDIVLGAAIRTANGQLHAAR
jgi:hypothetical protein